MPGVTIMLPSLSALTTSLDDRCRASIFLRIEVDQDGAVLAADGHGGDAALDGAEHVAHPDAADVLDVGLVHGRDC